jgi:hypothetical protein
MGKLRKSTQVMYRLKGIAILRQSTKWPIWTNMETRIFKMLKWLANLGRETSLQKESDST